jgi:hypothetical protein
MDVWLDDLREPWKHGRIGWTWIKTAEEVVELLAKGKVRRLDLDHDLTPEQTIGQHDCKPCGCFVLQWLKMTKNHWPEEITIHTANPAAKEQMLAMVQRHYGKTFQAPIQQA